MTSQLNLLCSICMRTKPHTISDGMWECNKCSHNINKKENINTNKKENINMNKKENLNTNKKRGQDRNYDASGAAHSIKPKGFQNQARRNHR